MSEPNNEIAPALVQARKACAPLRKTRTANVASAKGSYQYTYSTLDDLYDATIPALADAGLVPLHNVETAAGVVGVSTTLLHASGQFVQFDPVWLPAGNSPQAIGSSITYGKRYSLSAALALAAEDDDDGQRATADTKANTQRARGQAAKPMPATTRATTPEDTISDAQRRKLFATAKDCGWEDADLRRLLGRAGYASSKDIRVADFDRVLEALETGELLGDDAREPGSDDGDVATAASTAPAVPPPARPSNRYRTISAKQQAAFTARATERQWSPASVQRLLERVGVHSLSLVNLRDYDRLMHALEADVELGAAPAPDAPEVP